MAVDPNQILLWAKTKMFGNWAPEDQEWGMQEFLKDMGWSVNDLATAIENKRFDEWSGHWFKTKGHAKTKARNDTRDGVTPEQIAQKAAAAEDQKRADAEGRTAKINSDLDAFFDAMMQPIDPNDPEIARVASMAGRQAAGQSFGRGIEGGLAVENTQRMAGDAAANMFQQERARRQGLAQSVLGLRAASGINQQDYLDRQRQFRVQQDQFRQGLDYQNAMDQWQQRAGVGQAFGSILGAGLGAIPGALAMSNPLTAASAPGLLGAGITTGAGLGGGLGGLGAGGPPRRNYSSGY